MTWLPILQRELRVRARSRASYWGRFGVGLVGLLLGLPPLAWAGFDPAGVGRGAFTSLVGAAFLLSCAACLVTADSVSAERREGTLGLLFLTGVKHFDVLVGKLAANSLPCVFGLVAFLPVLMVAVLAGGVSGGEVARKGLVLLNTLFLALSAGLWASTRGYERFRTARAAVLLVAGLVLVPSVLGWLVAPAKLGLASPLGGMLQAADSAYRVSSAGYWVSLGLVQLAAWGLLLASLASLRAGLRADGDVVTARAHRPKSAAVKALLETRPLEWLFYRQRGMRAMVWVAALMSFVSYLFSFVYGWFGRAWSPGLQMGIQWSFNLTVSGINGALLAWVASRFFVEARRSGELELLLTTPVRAEALVSAQWEGLKRLLRWPVVVMVAPLLLQVALLMQRGGGLSRVYPNWGYYYGSSMLLGAVNTVLGVGAVCWLGLWFGLRAAGQARAILWTVGIARGGPYVLSLICSLVAAGLFPGMGVGSGTRWVVSSLAPQALLLVGYVWVIRRARRQVAEELSGRSPRARGRTW